MPDVNERQLDCHNFFLIKHVLDDKEAKDELLLIGTMVQHVFRGGNPKWEDDNASKDSNSVSIDSLFPREEEIPIMFNYRFNDQTADKKSVDLRRTEIHETRDLGKDYRHTFQIKVPLELEVEFDAFPFKIKNATLMIELSTITSTDNKTRLRPNILVHKSDKRTMLGIQKDPKAKTGPAMEQDENLRSRERALFRQALEKIDKTCVYDFVSPFPNVTYLYDSKKKYCPKYSVRFLLVEDGMQKFMEIVCPIFLIAAMNHLNVINALRALEKGIPEQVEAVDYLNNSATLALAIVVFLPTMIGSSRFHSVLQVNNLYIATIFCSLALSAFPYSIMETMAPAQVGAYLFWASFLFPIVNGIRFMLYIRRHKSPGAHHFMSDAHAKRFAEKSFKPSSDKDVMDDFISIGDLVMLGKDRAASMDFKLAERRGKFEVIEIDTSPVYHGSG